MTLKQVRRARCARCQYADLVFFNREDDPQSYCGKTKQLIKNMDECPKQEAKQRGGKIKQVNNPYAAIV